METSCYQRASGFVQSNGKIKRRIDRSQNIRELLRTAPTKKISLVAALTRAIEFSFENGRRLLESLMNPFFRKLAFRRVSLRRGQLERACYELAGSLESCTVVGFGDCDLAGKNLIKKCPTGSVKEFVQRLLRLCQAVVVDEYLTSKEHHECSAIADHENQQEERICLDGIVRKYPVHKVLHCLKKHGGCGKTEDRDVNAAHSALKVLQRQPAGLSERSSGLQRRPRS